jgi:murein DD-endopeptidase MepM/ murein hydrolase activator NlpD
MTLLPVVLISVGLLLVYSSVKNKKPVDVVKDALRGTTTAGPISTFFLNPSPGTTPSLPGTIPIGSGKAVRPVSGGSLSARFGQRGNAWSTGYHTGLDFVVPSGTPVYAVTDGIISKVSGAGAYGNHIVQTNADGTQFYYAHLSKVGVGTGARVRIGQVIGYSGETGNTTGPHLHFEVRRAGVPTDPAKWLAAHGVPVESGAAT